MHSCNFNLQSYSTPRESNIEMVCHGNLLLQITVEPPTWPEIYLHCMMSEVSSVCVCVCVCSYMCDVAYSINSVSVQYTFTV